MITLSNYRFIDILCISEVKSEEESSIVNAHTEKSEEVEKDLLVVPRPLHKTCSIFLRNLAPSITKQEVEAVSLCFHICIYTYIHTHTMELL